MAKQDKMIEKRKKDSDKKNQAVVNAVTKLKRSGNTITLASVAREAKVSPSFIYSHPDLCELVDSNRTLEPKKRKKKASSYVSKKTQVDMYKDQARRLGALATQYEKERDSYKEKYENLYLEHQELSKDYNTLLQYIKEKYEEEETSKFPSIAAKMNNLTS